MPFAATKYIVEAYYPPEEFMLITVYAPLGYGKSAYQFKVSVEVLQQIYHITEAEAWELLKKLIIFHPSQFFNKIKEIETLPLERAPVLNWDDAGLWLYAMEWNDPFVEAFTKYLNVARTHLACMILSTPSPQWILKKLRHFPQALNIKIIKANQQKGSDKWLRLGKAYMQWVHPDLKHSGVHTKFKDYFNCRMPNSFFKWYKPLRDAYEDMALALLREKWEQLADKSKSLLLKSLPQLCLPPLDGLTSKVPTK